MNKHNQTIFKLTALSTAIWLSCAALAGGFEGKNRGDVDLADYECEDCPELLPWEFTLKTNLGYLDNDARRFRRYSGIEDGAQLFLDGLAVMREEDGFIWRTEFHNLGLDSGGLTSSIGVQGLYNLTFDYQSTIAVGKDYLRSPYSQVGNNLTLDTNWVPSNDTADFNSQSFARRFDLTTDWQTLGLNFKYQTETNLHYSLDYRQLSKEGLQEYSVAQMLNAAFIPLPIDNKTTDLEGQIRWLDDNWNIAFTALVSRFDNQYSDVTVDYPFVPLTSGSDQIQMSLAPEHVYTRLSLDGRYRYGQGSYARVRYSSSTLEQEESLLEYSLNPTFQLPLPTMSLDAEVDTENLQLQLLHRFDKMFSVNIKYVDKERDNKTPVYNWSQVITDLYVAGMVQNLPYDYKTERFSTSFNFRWSMDHRFNITFSEEEKTRNLQQVTENKEDGYTFNYHGRLDDLIFNFRTEQYDRSSSPKTFLDYLGVTENPLLSRFNVAQRKYTSHRFQASYPLNESLDIHLTALNHEQDYRDTQIGLTENFQDHWGIDLNWRVAENVQLNLYYQEEQIDSEMAGSNYSSQPDWLADTEDNVDSYGLDIRFSDLNESGIDLNLSFNQSDATSNVLVNQLGVARSLPEVYSDWTQAEIEVTYPWSEKLTLGINYHYEDFGSNDYAYNGSTPGSLSRILTMGGLSEMHGVNYIQLSAEYLFH